MRPKTSPTWRFASSRRPWVAAAALILLVGTACTDQPEATDQGANSPSAADPGAKANSPPPAGAQDPERRQQRIAQLRKDRYAELGLSDEQQQSIEALRAEQQAWYAEHRDEVRALGNKRKAARQAGDEAEAEAIRLQLRELRETLPTEQDIVAVLTDEQRAQLRKNRPIALKGRPSQRQAPPAQAADAAPPPP
jgi:Spy/CpxP family protein refolding chaperone